MSSGRKVVVLGGSGFLGTRLVERISAQGWEVVVADKRCSEMHPHLWMECDVRDKASLQKAFEGASRIINLAAEHQDDVRPVELYDQVNVEGARNVCAAAESAGISRILFTSSVAVYGLKDHVVSESEPCLPFNDYGRTKLEAEAVYKSWQAEDDTRSLVVVRPTVIFGVGNRGNVYNLLRQIATGRFLMVGSGKNRKSLAYVDNVVEFLIHTLTQGPGVHCFNYADQPDFEMRELVASVHRHLGRHSSRWIRIPYWLGMGGGLFLDAVAKMTGQTFPISAVRIKKFCANTRFSSERAMATGFTPSATLDVALGKVVQAEFLVAPAESIDQ